MKTKVFAHGGWVGIESNPKAEGLINDPSQAGQLGYVLDASHVEVSKEAIEVLKTIRRGGGSLGEVDCFKVTDGKVVFGWLGRELKAVNPADSEVARDTDFSLLEQVATIVPNDPPKEFVEAVDEFLAEGQTKE